jgi:hypothetical protein
MSKDKREADIRRQSRSSVQPTQVRAGWTKPALRRVAVSESELGATPSIGDGSFTTS